MLPMMREFVKLESFGGILLGLAAILALILQNTSAAPFYNYFLDAKFTIALEGFKISKPLLLWINDGLMAVFFLLVGLEIKREFLVGQLSSFGKMALPLFAAVGGLIVPALVFWFINQSHPQNLDGWAIPTATDIAFALGIMLLLGNAVPAALKVTLVAIAIIDDLMAIVIIAVFYTANLGVVPLIIAGIATVVLIVFNRSGIINRAPYVLVGVILWVAVLKSGVHATLAGVIVGLCIPLRGKNGETPLEDMEHALHPWVSYMILPLFAFANAGVPLTGMNADTFLNPLTLGIALGLFFGKQIGVMLASFLAIKLRISSLPDGVRWSQYYGMALVTGVGFTMSLFIGTLSFDDVSMQNAVRIGVLMGSLFAGIAGAILLKITARRAAQA